MSKNGDRPLTFAPQHRGRPMLLGDRCRIGTRDYALVGTVTSRGLAVALVAEWEVDLAPVYSYPATKLVWADDLACWLGEVAQDRSAIVLP